MMMEGGQDADQEEVLQAEHGGHHGDELRYERRHFLLLYKDSFSRFYVTILLRFPPKKERQKIK